MKLKKSGLAIGFLCYVIWGVLPAYWNLLGHVDSLFILCCRVVFAFVFTICFLAVTGRMRVFLNILKDIKVMRYLIPSSVLITINWGLYVWTVNSGRILDSSLGYYLNPLVVFLLGIVIFKERYTKLQLTAVALAFTGVLISLIAYGSVPYLSISLAVTFAFYGVLKKKAGVDPVAGIAVESLLIAPFAIVLALFFMMDTVKALNLTEMLLLVGGGVVTATPLILFSVAVNDIPFIIVGFFQYVSPSLALIYGLLSGETLSSARLVSFIFIGFGLIVFCIATIRMAKAEKPRRQIAIE